MDVEITTDKEDVNDDTRREEQVEDVAGITDGKLFGSKKEDIAYRHRFFHTACVCFSLFTMVRFEHLNILDHKTRLMFSSIILYISSLVSFEYQLYFLLTLRID
jgi:hypothetical protein